MEEEEEKRGKECEKRAEMNISFYNCIQLFFDRRVDLEWNKIKPFNKKLCCICVFVYFRTFEE